jgi:hypothetical protein
MRTEVRQTGQLAKDNATQWLGTKHLSRTESKERTSAAHEQEYSVKTLSRQEIVQSRANGTCSPATELRGASDGGSQGKLMAKAPLQPSRSQNMRLLAKTEANQSKLSVMDNLRSSKDSKYSYHRLSQKELTFMKNTDSKKALAASS